MSESPIGFAIVDAITPEVINVLHVHIQKGSQKSAATEVALSGIWEYGKTDKEDLKIALSNRVVVGTEDGLLFLKNNLKVKANKSILSEFVSTSMEEQEVLQKVWQDYKSEDEKKRKNLVPPKWPTWPENVEDISPIEILEFLGKQPYSLGTPEEMRPLIAFGRVVQLMLSNWVDIEEERTRRKFLDSDSDEIRKWPPKFKSKSFDLT